MGKWLTSEEAFRLLTTPPAKTLIGLRDRAILAVLLGCGLRRSELVALRVEDIQPRNDRTVLVDLVGKGGRLRTVPVPSFVETALRNWLERSRITTGPVFRRVLKGGRVGEAPLTGTTVRTLVLEHAQTAGLGSLAPHDLRRTCAKLCRSGGGDLVQIQLLLGHASVQTTERYLGGELELRGAVNDVILRKR